ncbi:hypothetical protein CMV_022028 [Castanea mollissima]|uniref:protein-serine/threonine phosphatase n=1 Tax=Castanea mollissima TaxID=60419 RepID=A0A8J4VC09_9ROSI|nr:hypothetical protein CMV_022028 [Castanea mollissima]
MTRLLDPENVYFGTRIISRDDSPRSDEKSFDLVLVPERMVIVLDDTDEVWLNHRPNLVSIERYTYFGSNSITDESETEGALVKSLECLNWFMVCSFTRNWSNLDSRVCVMAEELGAMRAMELKESVTFLWLWVQRSVCGLSGRRFLDHPRWVEAAYYLFERMPEQDFPVSLKKF